MPISSRIRAALALGTCVLGAHSANAASLIVVEARGVGLTVGSTVDSTKPLALKSGQHVTLISPTGATLKLDGPYNKAPDADQAKGVSAANALALLVTQRSARTGEVGTTRGTAPNALPTPWLFDVTRTGPVCLLQGSMPVFWRPQTQTATKLAVMPADRSWKAESQWPAGTDRISVTTKVPMRGGATYLVSVNGTETALSVSSVPAALSNDSMRAAWMAEKGCEAQAEALLHPKQ